MVLPRIITVTVPKRPDQPAGLTMQLRGGANEGGSRQQQQQQQHVPVLITSISPQSPFHPNNFDASNNDSNSSNNDTLQLGDEVLLINGHRARDAKRACKMIISTTCGYLTIVASRGRDRTRGLEHSIYHLARLDHNPYVNRQEGSLEDVLDKRFANAVQFGGANNNINSCGLQFQLRNHGSLVRISSILKNKCPFVRTGLKMGDVVLSIGGTPVRSVDEAEKLLSMEDASLSTIQEDSSRVVALLVYSFWDLRKQVLKEELQLDDNGTMRKWLLSWSHESNGIKEESPGEYVILKIPNTSVTFRLDFDEDGTCSCNDPFVALNSLPKDPEQDDEQDKRQRAQCRNSYSHVIDDDSDDSFCGSDSRSSRDEARAALDLLYQKRIQPTIDALNYHTWKQVRLLANMLAKNDSENDANYDCVRAGEDDVAQVASGEVYSKPDLSIPFIGDTDLPEVTKVEDQMPMRSRSPQPYQMEKSEEQRAAFGRRSPQPYQMERAEVAPVTSGEVDSKHDLPPPFASATDPPGAAKAEGQMPMRSRSPQPYQMEKSQGEQRAAFGRRSPQPYQMERVGEQKTSRGEKIEGTQTRRIRTPQPYQKRKSGEYRASLAKRSPQPRQVERRTSRRRSPEPSHPETAKAEGKRSPQPYQMEKAQVKSVPSSQKAVRKRSPQPYQVNGAQANVKATENKRPNEEEQESDNFENALGKLQVYSRRDSKRSNVVQQSRSRKSPAESQPNSDAAERPRRRPPAKLRRRPSIVPHNMSSNRKSLQTTLSAFSESDSSVSETSTTSSDDSSSSYDTESSEDEEVAPSPRTRDRSQRRSQMHSIHRQPPQSRRLSTSTELVIYTPPEQQQQKRNDNRDNMRNKSKKQSSKHRSSQPRLKMRNGDIRSKYKIFPNILGTGAFGTVRSCIDRKTNEKLAVKSISKKGNVVKSNTILLKNEIALVQRVKHQNVVRVVDVIQDRDYIHIVMEECRGGDLFDKIVDHEIWLGEQRTCEIIGSLLDAISYLHERNIVHRDLKAEHIMLSNNDVATSPVKIIDFGLATIHNPRTDPPMTAFAGSAFTVAPEVIKRSYGKECDLWSVGVITYFLLTQKMPFNARADKEIFQKIVSGDYGYPGWTKSGLSEEAKDFIDRLLVVDPKRRLTASQALSHLWIRKHNQTRLAGSINSNEQLALVPVEEHAIVVRGVQPRRPTVQKGTSRNENRQWSNNRRTSEKTSKMKNLRQSKSYSGDMVYRRQPHAGYNPPAGRIDP